MKLKMVVAAAVILTLLAGCDPKSGNGGGEQKPVPGIDAPFPVLYVLGDIYNDKRQIMYGVPMEVKGTLVGTESGTEEPLAMAGCQPAANDKYICNSPTVQAVDMEGVQSFTFTFRFLTNMSGWSVGCIISANKRAAVGIFDEERSDRTSANHQEVLATCSYP